MASKEIKFRLNGESVRTDIQPHENIVEVLHRLGLTGARESCGQGLCGCCTVVVNGKPVSGCLYLAAFVDGAEVLTVENSTTANGLDPVQEAFIETAGFQCGFCTPGMVLMSRELLKKNASPTDDEIRHHLAGNLCRCAAYTEIIEAVQLAARKLKGAQPA